MNENQILNTIKHLMEKESLESTLFDPSEQNPFGRLLVFLGADAMNRPKTLSITAQKQILTENKDSGILRVEFLAEFPFKIREGAANQVAGLIALLNHFMELPGLDMSEVDDRIFYRYVLLTEERSLDSLLIPSIVGAILLNLDLYSPSLEKVADGQLAYTELLEQSLSAITKKGS